MQTLPIWRATSAAWLVMPPNAVMKPSDAFMPRMSSGLVSWRHRIRLVSPLAASASASSAKNTTLPVAARLFLGDQFLVDHLDGDAHAGEPGALAVAALEHVERAVLDGELDVLHV